MLEMLKKILIDYNQIDGWKIIEKKIEASELFFIRDNLDMNRAKNVTKYVLTIYKDFSENGKEYRGSSSINIYPTMSEDEVRKVLESAITGAEYVYNDYYPLVEPIRVKQPSLESNFSNKSLASWLPGISNAIYQKDDNEAGGINSSEIFLNKIQVRIVNSKGVDVKYQKYKCELEIITNWKENEEEVELYKQMSFANFDSSVISEEVAEVLQMTKERTIASPTLSFDKQTVLLTGEPVQEFFNYYYQQANARQVYEKISTAAIGDNLQGDNIKGDTVTIKLDPFLKDSTVSAPYDIDGFPLKEIKIIDKGVLKRYWGDIRHSYYLGVEPTGSIGNVVVDTGQQFLKIMKAEPYLELLAFSDFQMDILTGDFAGEIRLGRYYDGHKTIPVTGGSISGNVKEVQQNMYLSAEKQVINNFVGPRTIKLFDISISGS